MSKNLKWCLLCFNFARLNVRQSAWKPNCDDVTTYIVRVLVKQILSHSDNFHKTIPNMQDCRVLSKEGTARSWNEDKKVDVKP